MCDPTPGYLREVVAAAWNRQSRTTVGSGGSDGDGEERNWGGS